MSIFRETFQDDIKKSLNARQDAMTVAGRTPSTIQYLHSRNSWIRMTSSVNVGKDNTLAKKNVLLGGTLNQTTTKIKKSTIEVFSPKSGVGKPNNAYSYKTPGGTSDNRLGLRPMPGITNMDVKSKSAYGSLREAVVNFQCWDIHQLEELELLYMRPGYTVLVEWGWAPYLDSGGNLVTTPPPFYDILNKGTTSRTKIFKELYDQSTASGGNYDAMFGYVKNYQWSARPDGGYDCQTTIISTGEIIESLKVNYVLPDLTNLNSSITTTGFLDSEFATLGTAKSNVLKEHYEKNILAGVWAEAYFRLKDASPIVVTPPGGGTPPPSSPPSATLSAGSIFRDALGKDKFSLVRAPYLSQNWSPLGGTTQLQMYITLEAAFDVINKYVIPKDGLGNKLMELSTQTEGYTGAAEDLLCVAHPVQVSVDPTVCLIKSPIWYDAGPTGILTAVSGAVAVSTPATKANAITKAADDFRAAVIANNFAAFTPLLSAFTNAVKQITTLAEYQVVNAAMGTKDIPYYLGRRVQASSDGLSDSPQIGGIMGHSSTSDFDALAKHLSDAAPLGLGLTVVRKAVWGVAKQSNITITLPTGTPPPPTSIIATTSIDNAKAALGELKNLEQPFFSGNPNGYDELGIIGNIFVNLDFLYRLSLDSNLESSDSKEKNEINLYKYVKNLMAAIQPAIGNINSFEVHVDPVDNKARVIDINFTKPKNPTLFELQVANLKSVVRNYSLQSQIFPEQSSIIAIGSQAKGGQLGMQNNTMIDFNKNLTDRIIEEKDFGIRSAGNSSLHSGTPTPALASNLGGIIFMFATLQQTATAPGAATDIGTLFNRCKSNLRDLIVYFQSITNSPGANRNIIPFKFSFEMDGIGGLVIGNLFTINPGVLPNGYKGTKGTGQKLAQTVTGISHRVGDGDWTTKIDALNISLNDKSSKVPFRSLDLATLINISYKNSLASALPPSYAGGAPGVTSPCPDKTTRSIFDLLRYPLEPTVFTSLPKATVLNYIVSKSSTYNLAIRRATYASFGGETQWGKSIINNNANGMQTDGAGWYQQDLYIQGTTNWHENGPPKICRAFATYATWERCIDHVLLIMSLRVQGQPRQVVPADANDATFFGDNYSKNWIGSTDPSRIALSKNCYQQAMRQMPR